MVVSVGRFEFPIRSWPWLILTHRLPLFHNRWELTVLLAALVSYAHLRLWDDAALCQRAAATAAAPGGAAAAAAAAASRETDPARSGRFVEMLTVQHAL